MEKRALACMAVLPLATMDTGENKMTTQSEAEDKPRKKITRMRTPSLAHTLAKRRNPTRKRRDLAQAVKVSEMKTEIRYFLGSFIMKIDTSGFLFLER